jgi:hypothetical protein
MEVRGPEGDPRGGPSGFPTIEGNVPVSGGRLPRADWNEWTARATCFRLFALLDRAAAWRTF